MTEIRILQTCIDKFWEDNKDLSSRALRDVYVFGRVSDETNDLARRAVDIWLRGRPLIHNGNTLGGGGHESMTLKISDLPRL